MATEFCPRCRSARTGDLRYCASCAFDFEGHVESVQRTAPTSTWKYTPRVPPVNEHQGRSTTERILIVLIILVVFGGGALILLNAGLIQPVR